MKNKVQLIAVKGQPKAVILLDGLAVGLLDVSVNIAFLVAPKEKQVYRIGLWTTITAIEKTAVRREIYQQFAVKVHFERD